MRTYEVTYAIRGDNGSARQAIVQAVDSFEAKDVLSKFHSTAITNITFMAVIYIPDSAVWIIK